MICAFSSYFRSLLPPGTLHIVFTPNKAICTGGYTYNASTMAKTVYTIFQNFVGSSYLTNTVVGNEFLALLRVVLFWKSRLVQSEAYYFELLEGNTSTLSHIPNLMRMDDAINLFTLLNFAELAWVLTPERHRGRKRKRPEEYQAAKAAADDIRKWVYSNFVLIECNGDAVDLDHNMLPLMAQAYLLQHAHLLVRHVEHHQRNGYFSEDISEPSAEEPRYISSNSVQEAIEADVCSADEQFKTAWQERMMREAEVMANASELRRERDELLKGHVKKSVQKKVEKIEEELAKLDWKYTGSTYAWPKAQDGYRFVIKRRIV